MDRTWASTDGTGETARRAVAAANDFALPSRAAAIGALRPLLEAQAGPMLVTGEPGVGKTWLCRRLQAELPPGWRWAVVDVPPGVDPPALYGLIGYCLGLPPAASGREESSRLALADLLSESTADGVRWGLVLDEAHNASASTLEEVRVLSNRLGRPDGFSALLLAGQTALACRLAARPLQALAARLAAHIHLRPLDIEEAHTLLYTLMPALTWDRGTLERHHRDSAGNPRRMLRAAAARAGIGAMCPDSALASAADPAHRGRDRSNNLPAPARPTADPDRRQATLAPMVPPGASDPDPAPADLVADGPFKPPLLVGDGMVEVGWEGGIEPEPEPEAKPPNEIETAPARARTADAFLPSTATSGAAQEGPQPLSPGDACDPERETVETIDDHYTALQAWAEWNRNRDRCAAASLEPAPPTNDDPDPAASRPQDDRPAAQPNVWAEGEHGFAPYGQLFSRLRHLHDTNGSS